MSDILKMAGWSKETTFARFYNKPLGVTRHSLCTGYYNNNNNGRNGSFFYVAGYLIEERRRWPVITASPRGQCSK